MLNLTEKVSYIDINRLAEIIVIMDKYMIIILYIMGTIGAILNIITFIQKQIRINSCSVYFLSTSIVDLCIMNLFILLEIIVAYNKSLSDYIYSTRIWCKLGNYLMLLFPCLSSSYITFASIDRFCISSLNQTFRKWSSLKTSRIVVIIIFVLWALFGLHVPIAYDRIQNTSTGVTQCIVQTSLSTTFIIIDGFFFALFNGAIVPFLLCIFGLLIIYNMKRSRERVIPQQNVIYNRTPPPTTTTEPRICLNLKNNVQKRTNTHMLRMLSVQVTLTIIFNIPYVVIYLMGFYKKVSSDPLSLYVYVIFSFIARWFYYMNYCKTFYINTLTSKLFRNSLRKSFTYIIDQRRRNFSRTMFSVQTNA